MTESGRINRTACRIVLLCLFGSLASAQSGGQSLGANLISNPGFEQLAANAKPAGWYDNGFTVDRTVRRTGEASLRLTDAHLIPYVQSAGFELFLPKGTYYIGGWVKTEKLAATQGSGVRICLRAPPSYPWSIAVGCTAIVNGTSDWRYLAKADIAVSQDTMAALILEAYGEPDGTAWFDDVELRPVLVNTGQSPPTGQNGPAGLGPNLLANAGFEELAGNGKPVGWYDNGFTADRMVWRSGSVSHRVTDAHLIPFSQSAATELTLSKGAYYIAGWVKTDKLAATRGSGVRICLRAPPTFPWAIAVGCTEIVTGTKDWTYLSKTGIVVSQDTKAAFVLEAYGDPDGTAWFDDVELRAAQSTIALPDTTPPVISGIAVSNVTGTSAMITWRTDEPATRQVEYGTSTAYGMQTPLDSTMSTTHQVLLSGLRPATTYHFRVRSRDAAGNLAVSANQTFSTLDTIPPLISALAVSTVTGNSATITWVTDEPADTQLDYGTTTAYGSQSPLDARLKTSHSVTLTGLAPGTTYHCRARSRDAAGNLALSADLTFQTAAPSGPPVIKTGGLTAYSQGQLGPNVIANGSFEQPGANGKPLGWSDNGFVMDSAVARTGSASYRLTDAHLIPYSQAASQQLALKKGIYEFSVWVKLNNLAATQGSGVRACFSAPPSYPWQLVRMCTTIVKGTSDWQKLALRKIVLPQDATAAVTLETYGDPDGTAWFDDVELRREHLPLSVFMLYPNYRGLLFDDQSQTARFQIAVDPPEGTAVSSYQVAVTVTDEVSGQLLRQATYPAAADFVAHLDLSGALNDRTYLARFRLLSGNAALLSEYPAFRIAKVSGSVRQQMAVSYDANNRILLRGRPTFLLGVYDAGLGYYHYESGWENLFGSVRRLFELPINLYLNYWYGEAGNAAWIPMMNVLQQRGILALTNANCFDASAVEAVTPNAWFLKASEDDIRIRASHAGFLGFYAADECTGDLAENVFGHYQRMKSLDQDGLVLGTLLGDSQLVLWPEAVDLLATDPYPLYGAEPAGGYDFGLVGEWTRRTQAAVYGSRPIASVLQFFQFTSKGRWPTQAELRNMSYMAITEGANGLLYWGLGVNALASVCSGWCDEKVEYFNRLKAVLQELKALEPALTAVDRPDFLASSSNVAIRTRVKYAGGKVYVFAYNSTPNPASAVFTLNVQPAMVEVYAEGRAIAPSGTAFSDAFGPWQARVYVVTPR